MSGERRGVVGDGSPTGANEGGMMDAVVTPIEVRIGGNENIKIEAGEEARKALRRDALRSLVDGLEQIKAVEEEMPAMDDPTVQASLESLAIALRQATTACDALWYLAPLYDDGETVEADRG